MSIHLTALQAAQITRENQPGEPTRSEMPVEELRQWKLKKTISEAAYQGFDIAFLDVHRTDVTWLEEIGFKLQSHRQDDEEEIYLATRLEEENDRLGRAVKRLDEKTDFLQIIFNTRTSPPTAFLNFLIELFEKHPEGVDNKSFFEGMSKFPLAAHVNFPKYPYLIEEVIQCKRSCVAIERKIAALEDNGIYIPTPIESGYLVSWKIDSSTEPTDDAFTPEKMAWLAGDGQNMLNVLFEIIEECANKGISHVSIFLSLQVGLWRIFENYDQQPLDMLTAPNLASVKELIESLGYGIAQRSFTFTTIVDDEEVSDLFYEFVVYWQDHVAFE